MPLSDITAIDDPISESVTQPPVATLAPRDINGDITSDNVLPTGSRRYVALVTALNELESDPCGAQTDYDKWVSIVLLVANLGNSPSFRELESRPDRVHFEAAIKKEYASLEQNQVFSKPMPLPQGRC